MTQLPLDPIAYRTELLRTAAMYESVTRMLSQEECIATARSLMEAVGLVEGPEETTSQDYYPKPESKNLIDMHHVCACGYACPVYPLAPAETPTPASSAEGERCIVAEGTGNGMKGEDPGFCNKTKPCPDHPSKSVKCQKIYRITEKYGAPQIELCGQIMPCPLHPSV